MTKLSKKLSLRKISIVSVPLLLLSLGACASPFRADVARFQQLPAPQGQTFTIQASDPKLQGGLEFAQYAKLVNAQMSRVGYTPARDPASANLVVSFDYRVDNGRERIRSSGFGRGYGPYDPFYSGFGNPYYRRGFYRFGYYDPFFFGSGYNDIDSVTIYNSELQLKIDRASDGQRVFEGTAQAMSSSRRLQYLVPNLVEALFTDFPGDSGEVVRISIAPEGKTRVQEIN